MENIKPKVTVLIPIYNVEKYISKCLESIENQTFTNWEAWAVDDGSTDNSAEIVKKYIKKDSRIKLIQKENGGYGSVLEYGAKNIKTEYFLVCDPDDWLSSDALEKLVNFSEKNKIDVLVGDKVNVYSSIPDDSEYVSSKPAWDKNIRPKKIYKSQSDIEIFAFFAESPHAKLYRTRLVKDIVFPKKVSYTDFVLYILALSRAESVAWYNEGLAYYLTDRPGNSKTDVRDSIVHDYIVGIKAIIDQLDFKSKTDYSLFYLRLCFQIKWVLVEYARVSKNLFKDKYIKEIYSLILQIQKYRLAILKGAKSGLIKISFLDSIFLKGILRKSSYELMVKAYILKQRKSFL